LLGSCYNTNIETTLFKLYSHCILLFFSDALNVKENIAKFASNSGMTPTNLYVWKVLSKPCL